MQVVVESQPSTLVAGGQVTLASGGMPAIPVVVQQQRQRPPVGLNASQQKSMKILGGLQIAIGASCIVIGSILVSLNTGTVDGAGSGIWCGLIFALAGVFALVAAFTNKLGLIITTMIMSIVSSMLLWNLLGMSSASIDNYTQCGDFYRWTYYSCRFYNYTGLKAADGLLLIFSVAELIVSIWCAVVCCQGSCRGCCASCCQGCCCDDAYNYQVGPQVVHYMNASAVGPGGPQIVLMAHPGLYGVGNLGIVQQSYTGGLQQVPAYGQQQQMPAYGQQQQVPAYGQQQQVPAYGQLQAPAYGQSGPGGYSASSDAVMPADAEKCYLASTSS